MGFVGQDPHYPMPTLWLRGTVSVLFKQHEMERAVLLAKEGGSKTIF
ncbi:hypothetical protein J0B03_05215 [Alkalibacter rhizosphaerae]|uniref:Uncharacterized protein n=1 Tax=Alkalibacter rhizosphaerae TaxID=2815577 RepID=A0A974XGJ8_9FIRM|nr:hypothetical protein [Alkalibacter rhizosphaerae]QSX09464.1 hypothetical protein J0B03_05215 [Alkalibacter rhizosphaerae]